MNLKLSDFDFELSEELIALRPANPRDSSKLLIVDPVADSISDNIFSDLPNLLKAGDVLVFNSSKTIRAALYGVRPKRSSNSNEVSVSANLHKQISQCRWKAFIKPAKRIKAGDNIFFGENFRAFVKEKDFGGEVLLEFDCDANEFENKLQEFGQMPIPPYIGQKRAADEKDEADYQTIYADKAGSVATPTAGLHFTKSVFDRLDAIGVERLTILLHVGAGTFLPVKTEDIQDHKMHEEWFEISGETAKALNKAKSEGRRIICVGTTSLRALESSLSKNGEIIAQAKETSIFLHPGKKIHFADGLISNFHLPKSTLLMLLSAFCGIDIVKSAYSHAIKMRYRFFSYGDAGLWWRNSDLEI